MNNAQAIEYARKIERLTNEINRLTDTLDKTMEQYDRELSRLPEELKELDQNGRLVPNSQKSYLRSLIK